MECLKDLEDLDGTFSNVDLNEDIIGLSWLQPV